MKKNTRPTQPTISESWSSQANLILKGARVVQCSYMSKTECDNLLWDKSPICITLSKDGKLFDLIVSSDDEQNNGGTALVEFEETYVILPAIDIRYLNQTHDGL